MHKECSLTLLRSKQSNKLTPPTSASEVRGLVKMTNYVSRFIINIFVPLRDTSCTKVSSSSGKRSINSIHPHNNPVKAIILNNFKTLQNDPETGAIFSQPPLISFKRDKNVDNFLVRSTFKTIKKPGTFKCARSSLQNLSFHSKHQELRPLQNFVNCPRIRQQ